MTLLSWSYENPKANLKDEVRFLVGDTNTAEQLLQDEEIEYLLDEEGSAIEAAIAAAYAIAAKFSRQADIQDGQMRISASQKAAAYTKLAENLKTKMGVLAVPYAGGISLDEKKAQAEDASVTHSAFTRGIMKNTDDFGGGRFGF